MLEDFQEHPSREDCLPEEHEAQREQWEHEHMMREDYQALFYRKLNLIIMLEECEQAYQEREILMISHRDHPDTGEAYTHRQHVLDVHPVTFLCKQMVRHNQRLKAEMGLRKREAEVQVEIERLEIDRKCLLEEIVVFTSTINDIAYQKFQENHCKTAQTILIQQGKRYNLSTTIIGFIRQAKEIAVANIIAQCLKSSLKRVNFNSSKPLLKLQQLRGIYRPSKSKRELLEHITLYLKEFRSSNIFKQLTESLHSLLAAYDSIDLHFHYLFNKIAEEIFQNLQRLATVNRELQAHSNQVKDHRIDIQILVEEIKISERELKELEQRSAECIDQEAAFLSRQYGQAKNLRQLNESFGSEPSLSQREYLQAESDYFSYFHQKLKQKYQQFVRNQLQDAQHIRILKENIEVQTNNLQNLRRFYNAIVTPPRSQLNTHRTIEESVFSEFNYPLKEAPLNESTKPSQQRSSEQSLNQSLKRTSLPGQKEKILVKKIFKISNSAKPVTGNNQRDKIYELKLTKKHIILQQQTKNTLQFNQKVQIQRIKGHKLEENEQMISFDCGSNTLKLQFVSGNIVSFVSKLDRLNRMAKENYMSSRR